MLDTFMDEVVAKGAEAILPQHLDDKWLFPMAAVAKRFLRHGSLEGDGSESSLDLFEDMEGSLFLAAVTEILQSRYDYPAHFQMETLPEGVLYKSVACYSLYLALEEMKRKTSIPYPHPDPDTLLEPERLSEIEQNDSRISEYLYRMVGEDRFDGAEV